MKNLLSQLTGEQALDVLKRLAAGKGAAADAVLAEAKRVLAAVDVEEIANEVSEFKDWCVDVPGECAGSLLDEWRERNSATSATTAMDAFIRQRCPDWANYMTRDTSRHAVIRT